MEVLGEPGFSCLVLGEEPLSTTKLRGVHPPTEPWSRRALPFPAGRLDGDHRVQ